MLAIDEHLPAIRVCFVIPSLHYGGAERWTLDLARHCNPMKVLWTGTVVAHPEWVDQRMLRSLSALMPVFHDSTVWERGQRRGGANLDEAAEHLLGPADVVVTWEIDEYTRGLVDRIGIPVVNVAHRHDRASLSKYLKQTDNLVTVWPSCRGTFGEDNIERVVVIPNGVDLNRCYPLRSRAEMRQIWGCSDAAIVVGYLGRIDAHKNCVAIARAVQGLGDGAFGVLVGSSTSRAADVETAVRNIVGDRVHICSPVEDIGSALAAIDVFMLPSRSEVCSLSLLEAWAATVPVVATRVGAVPDLEAELGPLVVPMDPETGSANLARAVRQAISGSLELAAMRQRAADVVRQRFNVLQMARAWDDYLVELTGPARSEEKYS